MDDLRDYAGAHVVTEDSPRRLSRASELVDSHLLAAVYEVDAVGYPTDTEERDALRRATCALVEWWHETSDPISAAGQYSESQIGTVRLKRADPAAPSGHRADLGTHPDQGRASRSEPARPRPAGHRLRKSQ